MSAPDGPLDGFLARWSKRKRAGAAPEAEAQSEQPAVASLEADAAGVVESASVAEPEPEFDVSTLPSLEELTAETDIRGFLQNGVPEALKNAALRKAWALDPFLRDYVGPVENGYNFNDPASIPGFGEMDVRVDNSAMLRQIMGEKDPDAAPETLADAVPADAMPEAQEHAAAQEHAVAQEHVVAQERAGNPENDSPNSQPLLTGSRPQLENPPAIAAENSAKIDAATHNDRLETIDENRDFPRRQRHGGAVPN